jgi:hypothetical protein
MTGESILIKYEINVSTGVPSRTIQFITNVASFGPFLGPSSDLYTRSHGKNSTSYLMYRSDDGPKMGRK